MESLSVKLRNKIGTFVWFIDYYIYLFTRFFKKIPQLKNPSSILIIETAGIGDTIGAIPVIKTLKQHYPKAKIDILVSEQISPLLQNNIYLNKIIPYLDFKSTLTQIKGIYDLAVLLAPGSKKISKMLKNAGIPFRIGCTRRGISQGKGFYLTKKAKPVRGITHTIDNNLNVLKTINITATNRTPELFTTKQEDKDISDF